MNLKYKRIVLKLSGEALMGNTKELYDSKTIEHIATQIQSIYTLGAQILIVIGGGNIFRGINASNSSLNLERTNADYMGMLATAINGIALRDFLKAFSLRSVVYSAFPIGAIIDGYNKDKVLNDLANKNIVICVGGTGNPLFSTDSGAALRAVEIKADLLVKATKVSGIYDKDPIKFSDAKKFNHLSYSDAITQNLQVMDLTAFDLCKSNNIPIEVCNIFVVDTLKNSILGNHQGTLVQA